LEQINEQKFQVMSSMVEEMNSKIEQLALSMDLKLKENTECIQV